VTSRYWGPEGEISGPNGPVGKKKKEKGGYAEQGKIVMENGSPSSVATTWRRKEKKDAPSIKRTKREKSNKHKTGGWRNKSLCKRVDTGVLDQ